ncbi:MAG: Xaa-Pro peptidase family protein [Firmicutes bacterium]|nr:Xaa-Pro peptidase family protein [Bacillota bacterium]
MNRLQRLRATLAEKGLDGLLVQKPENRRYLSGFTGSAGVLLVTARGAHLLTDFRYTEQAAAQAPDFQIHRTGDGGYVETLVPLLQQEGVRRLGFESDYVTVDAHAAYQKALGDAGVELVPAAGLVERLRQIKDPEEVAAIRRAAAIADAAFQHILGYIRPGVTEREVALELEFFMKRQGASALAFDTIVASGPRSSLPHGVASDRVIGRGEFVTLDFGCVYQGYCSDMTRTVMVGEPDEKQREIYEIVLTAQRLGVEAARPGITGRELDAVCRDYIAQRGYGEYFGHGTGHGVGLYIHEEPRVSQRGETVLEPGHVVTIEPGIYLPGWGGVRIEDLVVITETGAEVLSQSPKDLIILE